MLLASGIPKYQLRKSSFLVRKEQWATQLSSSDAILSK
jgi:hypothetical protein